MRAERLLLAPLLALLLAALGAGRCAARGRRPWSSTRRWIVEMKDSPRGPFSAIKWFCATAACCRRRTTPAPSKDKGWQHGEWSERTRQLRAQGFQVANLLAGMDADKAVADPAFADPYAQMAGGEVPGRRRRRLDPAQGAVLSRRDPGRGRARGRARLLTAMAARRNGSGWRFVALRTGARLLPHGADTASAQKVRNLAAALADRDAGFQPLRVKIHGSPDAGDAAAVRAWAGSVAHAALREQALALAAEIDRVYHAAADRRRRWPTHRAALASEPGAASALREAQRATLARRRRRQLLRCGRAAGAAARWPADVKRRRAAAARRWTCRWRSRTSTSAPPRELRPRAARRRARHADQQLRAGADAAYGTGLIGRRQRAGARRPAHALSALTRCRWANTWPQLRTSACVPGWGTQTLRMQFGEAMDKLAEIEPKAELFVQDQVRGSPLLFYSQRLDMLSRDANRLAGVQHKLLGKEIGTGFTALNPGLARGVLHAAPDMKRVDAFRADGIYLLPETVSDLPPLAGILTAGAGNPLSHVQLLARNLGIPNVAVDQSLLPELQRSDGRRIVLAVSRAGLVEINDDGPQWDAPSASRQRPSRTSMFEPDVAKLDLTRRDFISLRELRATDSGRLVGPKAAKLGELMSHFPDRVAPGVGIPFGLYREAMLDRPYKAAAGRCTSGWCRASASSRRCRAGSAEAAHFSEQLRAEIYSIVSSTDPGPRFRERLRAAMAREFGAGFNGGVFIRSDTNVEDLPGFTGAGLNLTLFNMVGFDNIVKGISRSGPRPTPRAPGPGDSRT